MRIDAEARDQHRSILTAARAYLDRRWIPASVHRTEPPSLLDGRDIEGHRIGAFFNGCELVPIRRAKRGRGKRKDAAAGRLFDAIEAGVVDKNDAMAKERMTSLKALRDQAAADAERTQLALDSSGNQGVSPDMLKGFVHKARERIRPMMAATAATICARWASATLPIIEGFRLRCAPANILSDSW